MLIRILTVLVFACLSADGALTQDTVLTFGQVQTAGISGFRAHWDHPIPLSEDGAVQFVDSVVKGRSPTAAWSAAQRRGRAVEMEKALADH